MIKTLARNTRETAVERGPFTRAYSTQYVSLMFIVLTFVIGSFVASRVQVPPDVPRISIAIKDQGAAPMPKENAIKAQSAMVGKMNYHDLFEKGATVLNPDVAGALLTFMRSHDLNARFEIASDAADERSPGSGLESAVARAVTLSQFFEGKDVPFAALDIVALPDPSDVQVTAIFYKEAADELP